MVEAVARHGYAGTTLREVVTLAGVSKSTFYEHFDNKENCFLATFEEVTGQVQARVEDAYRRPGDFREKLVAALGTFMQMVVEEPTAASLAVVESLTLGAAGVAHRERASEEFELMVQQSFDHSGASQEVSPLTVRAIVAGIRGVVYRRLRAGRPEQLPALVETLVDWALIFAQPDSEAMSRARERARRPAIVGSSEGPSELDGAPPGWDEPPDSRRSRRALTQRERIIRGAARVVVENGYAALSIPAISGAAGISNQTFYEHFSGKREAFLAAFDVLARKALRSATNAFEAEDDRPAAVGAGVRALLDHVVENDLFARLAFFEMQTAGPAALDRADAILDSFTAYLRPRMAAKKAGGAQPDPILEATGSGIWATIQHEIAHGRLVALPQLAPDVTRLTVASFDPE